MTNKTNHLPPQVVDFTEENSVHIAGGTGAEVNGLSNDFKPQPAQKHSDLRGKRTVKWCSSAVERPVHIGKVGGSRPSTTTVPRAVPLAALLAQKDVADRFWSKVAIGAPNECWEWQGAQKRLSKYQSCQFKITSHTTVIAPRCAYALATGVEPGQLWVLHRCDNPACCNPAHLYLGSVKENNADAKARNRNKPPAAMPGSSNPSAKLTDAQVENVRVLIRQGKTNTAIGDLLGVHHSTISSIRRGKTWR